MTIEAGPSDFEDCALPNRFEIDLGAIAVAMHLNVRPIEGAKCATV